MTPLTISKIASFLTPPYLYQWIPARKKGDTSVLRISDNKGNYYSHEVFNKIFPQADVDQLERECKSPQLTQ